MLPGSVPRQQYVTVLNIEPPKLAAVKEPMRQMEMRTSFGSPTGPGLIHHRQFSNTLANRFI